MPYLVALRQEDLLACFIGVDVLNHPVRVEVNELDRKRLKRVTFRHVVLNALLELFLRESMSTNSFELVVGDCR